MKERSGDERKKTGDGVALPTATCSEWVSSVTGQVVTVTEMTDSEVLWTHGGFSFCTTRATFEDVYSPNATDDGPLPRDEAKNQN